MPHPCPIGVLFLATPPDSESSKPTTLILEKPFKDYPSASSRVLHQATVGREDIGLFRVLPSEFRGKDYVP